jgi:hypothetical protein
MNSTASGTLNVLTGIAAILMAKCVITIGVKAGAYAMLMVRALVGALSGVDPFGFAFLNPDVAFLGCGCLGGVSEGRSVNNVLFSSVNVQRIEGDHAHNHENCQSQRENSLPTKIHFVDSLSFHINVLHQEIGL